MKKHLLFSLLFLPLSAFSQVVSEAPQAVNEAGVSVIQMMSENQAGLELFKQAHLNGPVIQSATRELISDTPRGPGHETESEIVTQYVVRSSDCLGTDACEGPVQWTTLATQKFTGYTYTTTFKNSVVKPRPVRIEIKK